MDSQFKALFTLPRAVQRGVAAAVRRGHQLSAAVHELVRPGAAVAAPVRPHVLPVPAPPAGCRTARGVVRIQPRAVCG
jgi:hypothetical protein